MSEEKVEDAPKTNIVRMLSREEILEKSTTKEVVVDVPEWGGSVTLRELTAGDAMGLADAIKAGHLAAYVVARSAVTPDGLPMFTEDDVEALKTRGMRAMIRLQRAAFELNGLDDETRKADTAKNA